MYSINKVILVGALARDPEVRRMVNGNAVVNMSVVTNEYWKDKATGERKSRAEFHRVCIFDEICANFAETLHKGDQVYIEGALQTRKWTDANKIDRYSTEVALPKYGGRIIGFNDHAQPKERTDASRAAGFDDSIPF